MNRGLAGASAAPEAARLEWCGGAGMDWLWLILILAAWLALSRWTGG
jgi:hypothetical protein